MGFLIFSLVILGFGLLCVMKPGIYAYLNFGSKPNDKSRWFDILGTRVMGICITIIGALLIFAYVAAHLGF